jgi:glutathione synthase/RimK-type ligase-like ATP-grasp enzyme
MDSVVIVNNIKDFDLNIDDVEVVSAKTYLTETAYAEKKHVRIYNLCKSYRYQSIGYYVSLLAEARGQRVFPNITTIQDIKSQSIMRVISDEIDHLIQKSFRHIRSRQFNLSIYFGKNLAKQYDQLSKNLYNLFQAPLLRATFTYNKKWLLQNINPIPIKEIPDSHKPYVIEFAKEYFSKKRIRSIKKSSYIYDLAILVNPEEESPPSDNKALKKFIDAAGDIGFSVELINKDDFSRLSEFDALFIRETTSVNHHTYRFARRAHAEGLVVIDDPLSIVKCSNKVYLAEILHKAHIPMPETFVIHKYNKNDVLKGIKLPCVLKQPDSSFSRGVIKVTDENELQKQVDHLLENSDLIIAQSFTPTSFDWRIGVIDKKPLFACKYYMAKNHWQIYDWSANNNQNAGGYEVCKIDDVPEKILKTAIKGANLIGDGFYGVDLKEIDHQPLVIEINDNPSVDCGVEDKILKDELYLTIMKSFMNRIQQLKNNKQADEHT